MNNLSLNDKLFELLDNDVWALKSDIRKALLKIAQAFIDYLKDNGISIQPADIQLVGSNAGEDFTDNSDIDLHIVADFESLGCSDGIIQAAFNAQRSLFNSSYDISVKGIPVEMYVEDVKAGTESPGIFSVMYNRWIKYPEHHENIEDVLRVQYATKLNMWRSLINKELTNDSYDSAQRLLNRIYMMRKNGLSTAGRTSGGNYMFKQLRNSGYLDKLKNHRDEMLSNELTLENKITNILEAIMYRNKHRNLSNNTITYKLLSDVEVADSKLRTATSNLDSAIQRYNNMHSKIQISDHSLTMRKLSMSFVLDSDIDDYADNLKNDMREIISDARFITLI